MKQVFSSPFCFKNKLQPTTSGNAKLELEEQYVYGSGRLGMVKHEEEVMSIEDVTPVLYPSDNTIYDIPFPVYTASITIPPPTVGVAANIKQQCGEHIFELKDHLGNVHSTITDFKISVGDVTNTNWVASYLPDVSTATDYYSFGMGMMGRKFENEIYRYGVQSHENDFEIYGNGNALDYGARMYDPRLGRWFSLDPKKEFFTSLSPYHFGANSPIMVGDEDGMQNSVYIYIDPKLNLSKEEITTLKEKIVLVYERVMNSNPMLQLKLDFYESDKIIESKDLDPTDAMVVIGKWWGGYERHPFYSTGDPMDVPFGRTPSLKQFPAAVFYDRHTKYNNGINMVNVNYPNLLDWIAYTTIHETIHRLSKSWSDHVKSGNPYTQAYGRDHDIRKSNYLMSEGKDISTTIEGLGDDYFKLTPDRISGLNKIFNGTEYVFTNLQGILPFRVSVPVDNASSKSGANVTKIPKSAKPKSGNNPSRVSPKPRNNKGSYGKTSCPTVGKK